MMEKSNPQLLRASLLFAAISTALMLLGSPQLHSQVVYVGTFIRHEVTFSRGCADPPNYDIKTSSANIPVSYDCFGYSYNGQVQLNLPDRFTANPGPGSTVQFQTALSGSAALDVTWTTRPASGFFSGNAGASIEVYPNPVCIKSDGKTGLSAGTHSFSAKADCSWPKIQVYWDANTNLDLAKISTNAGMTVWDTNSTSPNTAFHVHVDTYYRMTVVSGDRSLRLETAAELFAGDPDSEIKIQAVKSDGSVDGSYSGQVKVKLGSASTPKIGLLKTKDSSGQVTSGTNLTLAMKEGKLTQPLFLQAPQEELKSTSILKPDTVLQGKAFIEAEADSLPLGSKEVTVKSPLDLFVDRIEVQQGVHQPSPGSLVRFKDLLIRVFVGANTGSFKAYDRIEGITATLKILGKNGGPVLGSPFTLSRAAFDGGLHPSRPFLFNRSGYGLAERGTGADSLNYVLLAKEDTVTLEVKLDDVYPDRDPANNSKALPPLVFASSKPQKFLLSRAIYDTGTDRSALPDPVAQANVLRYMDLSYPASNGSLLFVEKPQVVTFKEYPPPDSTYFTSWWNWNRYGIMTLYIVDATFFIKAGVADFSSPQYGESFSNNGVAVVFVASDYCSSRFNQFCSSAAHEIGHVYGLGDTYVNSVASPANSVNPNRSSSGQGNSRGNFVELGGFNWYAKQFVADPSSPFFDFMGVDSKAWIDSVTWNHLKQKLASSSQSTEAYPEQTSSTFVVVGGYLLKNGSGRISNCHTVEGSGLANVSTGSSYLLETLNVSGAVVNQLAFDASFRPPSASRDLDRSNFILALPFSRAVRSIRLRSQTGTLDTRSVSSNPPSVEFLQLPTGGILKGDQLIRWKGTDGDGDPLSYSLFYSPDGNMLIPLLEATTDTSYNWNSDQFPSGEAPVLLLTVTDGILASTIRSGTLQVPNRPPRIYILSPADGTRYAVGDAVELQGSMWDPEGSLDSNPALVWSSDQQGSLGTGGHLVLTSLTSGTHRITASGADSQGIVGTAGITVLIGAGTRNNCDVNGDGQVNVQDVQLLINRVLSASGSGDVNCDGRTDVLDIQVLINVVMGATCPTCSTPTTTLAIPGTTTTSTLSPATTSSTTTYTTTTRASTTTSSTTTSSATSTIVTIRPTTTTTTTGSSTTTRGATTTTTTLPGSCSLFGDDFSAAALENWDLHTAAFWQLVNGKLQVSNISGPFPATATHDLPPSSLFGLSLDVEVDSFNGTFYGFQPYSSSQVFQLGDAVIDGIGVGVQPTGNVGFLFYDYVSDGYFLFGSQNYGPVQKLGIQYTAMGVTLFVNGAARLTLNAADFGGAMPQALDLDTLDLLATGNATRLRFDNVCQSQNMDRRLLFHSSIPVGEFTTNMHINMHIKSRKKGGQLQFRQ